MKTQMIMKLPGVVDITEKNLLKGCSDKDITYIETHRDP